MHGADGEEFVFGGVGSMADCGVVFLESAGDIDCFGLGRGVGFDGGGDGGFWDVLYTRDFDLVAIVNIIYVNYHFVCGRCDWCIIIYLLI